MFRRYFQISWCEHILSLHPSLSCCSFGLTPCYADVSESSTDEEKEKQTVGTKRQNCKHAGRQTNLCVLTPTAHPHPLSHTNTKGSSVHRIHRCSVALRPTTKEQMHMHRLLSWILIIHKVNWMCFCDSWIFSSMNIKNETPPHFLFISFYSVILSLALFV